MTEFDALWKGMDVEPTGAVGGVVQRRLAGTGFDLFLTQSRPSKQAGFRASFNEKPGILWRDLRSSLGLNITVDARPGHPVALQLTEVDVRFHDIFSALITDLIKGLAVLELQPPLIRPLSMDFLAGRVMRWQACLRANSDGLSSEKCAGLFGELVVLRMLLAAGLSAHHCVDKWTGPSQAIQDFQFAPLAIEVKASRQTQPTTVRISSERQLDTSNLDRLLLIHIGLDERSDSSGQTLPALVSEMREAVGPQTDAGLLFDDRLIQYGYLDLHEPRYRDRSYAIRTIDPFDVRSPMSRLVESDLPPGVGDVAYGLSLAACEDYRLDDNTVTALFGTLQA